MMIGAEQFNSLNLPDRVNYMDSFYSGKDLSKTGEREVKKLLRSIVENENENDYVRRKALINMCEMTLVGKIMLPATVDVLFDVVRSHDSFLVILAVKYLFIFRENYEKDVVEYFEELSNSEDGEISSEATFRLGLIYFFKSSDTDSSDSFVKDMLYANKCFKESCDSTENRSDSEYYYWVSEFVLNVLKPDMDKAGQCYRKLVSNVWVRQVFSLKENTLKFDYKLYEVVCRIYQIANNNVSEWLDYRKGISELCNLHCELLNEKLSENLYESGLLEAFKDLTVCNILLPFYRNSFSANMSAIKKLQEEYSGSDEEDIVHFLGLLVEQASYNHKKKELDSGLLVSLARIFPTIEPERIQADARSMGGESNPEVLIKIFEKYRAEVNEVGSGYVTGARQGDDVFNRIVGDLKKKLPDYPVERMFAFQGVLSDIIKYVYFSTQAKNNYSNLLRFLFDENAGERELQDSLIAFLRMNAARASAYRPEISDVADGGRVDVLYEVDEITVPIELKKTSSNIDENHIRECYLSQAQTYVYPYDQLGIFVLLDSGKKDKEKPINNVRELFEVMHLEPYYDVKKRYPDYVVTVIVPGNKILPSSRSTYN